MTKAQRKIGKKTKSSHLLGQLPLLILFCALSLSSIAFADGDRREGVPTAPVQSRPKYNIYQRALDNLELQENKADAESQGPEMEKSKATIPSPVEPQKVNKLVNSSLIGPKAECAVGEKPKKVHKPKPHRIGWHPALINSN